MGMLLQPQVSMATEQSNGEEITQIHIFPQSAVGTHMGHKAPSDMPGKQPCEFSEVLLKGDDSQGGPGREGASFLSPDKVFAAR